MSSSVAHHVELPLGYSIVDRLGAGGYGEVWKATAPGGFEKAVKIVFGHCDEAMAERELKSLERIKSVRHPFLLSIERFEIVNNRLVIVTELADMSLSDCFQAHVSDGRSGIPREQLLAYMWDAAEALDCLLEQHSLQHLDIKPENLLVVGEHIKVADFGLVKELASKTLNSMMGGMTPLYSAPEIYDNNPSSRSDQYSLAIVYQQMLTGTLPFSGRTPAQLAKQHTLAEPNLFPLSEADRPIIRKAMEKEPNARFSSCREFISALRSLNHSGVECPIDAGENKSAYPYKPLENDDTKSLSLVDTKHIDDPICAAATQVLAEIKSSIQISTPTPKQQSTPASKPRFPVVDSTIEDIEIPDFDQDGPTESVPTLFVGVGGIGIKMLSAIRSRSRTHDPESRVALAWLAIDTERETLKSMSGGEGEDCFSNDEKLHIPLRRPTQYREDSQALLQWVSRRWLYNIPRSLQTRGFRPLGRIAIVDHAAAVLSALQSRLHRLVVDGRIEDGSVAPIRVFLLAGMSGGTGGGTIIDIAQAVRSICQQFSQEVVIHGVLGSTYHAESNDSLAAANMYALLTELSHSQLSGNSGENSPPGPASRYESPQRPLDEIYTVPIPNRSDRMTCHLTLQSIADYLLLETSGNVQPAMKAMSSVAQQEQEQLSLHTFCCVDTGQLTRTFEGIRQQQLLKAMVDHWLKQRSENRDPDAKHFYAHANSQFAHKILASFPGTSVDAAEPTINAGIPAYDSESTNKKAIRTAKIKIIAEAFLQFIGSIELQHDNNQPLVDSANVESACDQIVANVFVIVQHNELQQNELARKLSELFDDQLTALMISCSVGNVAELAVSALSLLEASPLNCGCRRQTLLVSPRDQADPELSQALKEACPTLANYETAVAEMYLVRKGSHLHPLQLGARLAELYPDIDEAAGRLHSRDDIKWRELRCY